MNFNRENGSDFYAKEKKNSSSAVPVFPGGFHCCSGYFRTGRGRRRREAAAPENMFINTFWSLVPPIIAIVLALLTKEVYSSFFVGIVGGALMLNNFNLENTMNRVFSGGFITSVTDAYNMGILVFLVLLGMIVALINKAGGSKAFGQWAETHIKTRIGAQLATICLGILIFIDDYFNCLTVGSVMRSTRLPPLSALSHLSAPGLRPLPDSPKTEKASIFSFTRFPIIFTRS